MKFCFVVYGPISFASSRLRAYWPAEYLEGAVVCDYATIVTDRRPDADVYVFLKHGRPKVQAELLAAGKQVWWDACDPMWWFSPHEVGQITEHVTGVTTSTAALASDFRQFSGMQAHVIPDRLKLEHYPMQRQHSPQNPVRFVWYGIGVNRGSLLGAWANLCRLAANGHNVSLSLVDDYHGQGLGYGEEIPVYSVPWSLRHENRIIASHDIALLPPYPGPWGQMKSNNKRLTAWASGLPVVDGFDYYEMLELVEDHETRASRAAEGYRQLTDLYAIERSATEWERLAQAHT